MFTTDSRHNLPIYPNLARRVSLTKLNQLWVADITFIRLRSEFVYLAVVFDAYSRRVIAWDLGRTLQAELAIRALQMALNERNWKAEELIHHSDRGVQYASSDYTEILEQRESSDQHEPARQSIRQRTCGTIYADAQRRGGARNGLSGSRKRTQSNR